jgi:hypothetical protein
MESKRDREQGALERKFTNFLRGKRSIPSSALLQQLPSGASGKKPEVVEPRVIVGLHLATTYSSFAYAHKSNPESIRTNYHWPGDEFNRDATPTASTTNQRLAERMAIFASAVGDTWPLTNSTGI